MEVAKMSFEQWTKNFGGDDDWDDEAEDPDSD
jgi:hypothetical protein